MIVPVDPSKYSAVEIDIMLGIATACVLAIITGLVLGLRALKVRKLSKDGAVMGDEVQPQASSLSLPEVSVHKTCGNGKDWVLMFAEHEDMLYSVYTKEFRIIDKQLTVAESELAIVRGHAQGVFLKLLKKKLKQSSSEGLIEHIDYERYEHALTKAKETLMPSIKKDFDLDDIHKMSEEQFRDYASLHAKKITQDLTDFLNLHYSGIVVSRENLYDENKDYVSDGFESALVNIYWSARKIAVETKNETSALRAQFRDKLKEMI